MHRGCPGATGAEGAGLRRRWGACSGIGSPAAEVGARSGARSRIPRAGGPPLMGGRDVRPLAYTREGSLSRQGPTVMAHAARRARAQGKGVDTAARPGSTGGMFNDDEDKFIRDQYAWTMGEVAKSGATILTWSMDPDVRVEMREAVWDEIIRRIEADGCTAEPYGSHNNAWAIRRL